MPDGSMSADPGPTWLGIDIGTSGVKSLLIDRDHQALGSAHAALTVQRPHPGWSEQDPQSWWLAVQATLDSLAGEHPRAMAQVRGVGLSGHMHGATLLDAGARVLRPCMLWNDGRAAVQCDELDSAADFTGLTGNLVMPGFTAPKLAWVRQHEPAIFERIAHLLLPKDFVRLQLTGELCSDMSDSAGTLWLDVARRCWSLPLLQACGLTVTQMPALVEGSDVSGLLKGSLARRWGMREPPVVAGGGSDNAASACAVGAVQPGSGFLSLGTSGVLFQSTALFTANPRLAVHAFCHAVPGAWHQMGVMLSATDCLNWLSRITSVPVDRLADMARVAPDPHRERVSFLPYLSGERTPHNDAAARAMFAGISHQSSVTDLAQAVLEGVAYGLVDCAQALGLPGDGSAAIAVVGGGARSDAWLQLIADATGLALLLPRASRFGAAMGAARLAICASEQAAPDEVCTMPEIARVFAPHPGRAQWHVDGLARYRALYGQH